MPKPTRTAKQLKQMLLERIEALPVLQDKQTHVHRIGVFGILAEEGGPNWAVRVFSERNSHRTDIEQVIRTLQGQYDLDD